MKQMRVEFEILPDGQFRIERKALRHIADADRVLCRRTSIFSPNSKASPLVGGRSPVSIFMVVVLPQPFEPTKPKISPREIEN